MKRYLNEKEKNYMIYFSPEFLEKLKKCVKEEIEEPLKQEFERNFDFNKRYFKATILTDIERHKSIYSENGEKIEMADGFDEDFFDLVEEERRDPKNEVSYCISKMFYDINSIYTDITFKYIEAQSIIDKFFKELETLSQTNK
jgi:hypothetical protein